LSLGDVQGEGFQHADDCGGMARADRVRLDIDVESEQ
jgi:hypothetical protein